jgi:hypothetical protein
MRSIPLSDTAAFQATLDLFETGLRLMRQDFRRDDPEAADADIDH